MRLQFGVMFGLALVASGAVAQGDGLFAGEVTASRLKLRAGPGEAYQPVVTLDRGAKVVVLGRHANDPSWYQVEVPAGYTAWVFGKYVERKGDTGTVTGDRLLVRPRATTRYHQLSGRLNRGEKVRVVEAKRSKDGLWYRIEVPRRIPLYAHSRYLKNVGAPKVARTASAPAGDVEPAAAPEPVVTREDERFLVVESDVREKLGGVSTSKEIAPLKRSVKEIDRSQLSIENRERRVKLLADLLESERQVVIAELKEREDKVKEDLEARLAEIDRNYRKRLAEIRRQAEASRRPRFTTTGIVEWSPDIVGRYPAYRISEGGKMKYFLIATHYDLSRFVGKRVGITGIRDPESGTGHETIMVRRMEILGDK